MKIYKSIYSKKMPNLVSYLYSFTDGRKKLTPYEKEYNQKIKDDLSLIRRNVWKDLKIKPEFFDFPYTLTKTYISNIDDVIYSNSLLKDNTHLGPEKKIPVVYSNKNIRLENEKQLRDLVFHLNYKDSSMEDYFSVCFAISDWEDFKFNDNWESLWN